MDLRVGQQVGASWQGNSGVGALDTNPHALRINANHAWDYGDPKVSGTASGAGSTTTLPDTGKSWLDNIWYGYRLWFPSAATGTATAGSGTTLTDSGQTWTANGWANWLLQITSGTGAGQTLPIQSNTGTAITVDGAFSPAPTAGSGYKIIGPVDRWTGTATAGGASTLTDAGRLWTVNSLTKWALRLVGGTGVGQELPIASNTTTVITVTGTWATNPDSTTKYAVINTAAAVISNTSTVLTVQASLGMIPQTGWAYQLLPPIGPTPILDYYQVGLTAGAGAQQTVQIRSNDFLGTPRILLLITPGASVYSAHSECGMQLVGVPNGNIEYVCSVAPTGVSVNARGWWISSTGTPAKV